MNHDMMRLCQAVERAQAATDPRQDDMREAIVRAVLRDLRTPSEEAAQAGGLAASGAMMGFAAPAICGLAAVRGTLDFILAE